MAKYWTFWWQIYLCTAIFSLPCLGGVDLNNPITCANGEYGRKSKDGQLTCVSCDTLPTCQHGLGISVACGDIVPKRTHTHCIPCVLGTNFSASQDNKPCQRCQSLLCHPNEKVLGSCKVDEDTSKCSGMCKTGLYPNGNSLDNCQPCSLCLNNASTLVKKCKDDAMPIEKQCEVAVSTVPPVVPSKLFPTKKNGGQGRHNRHERQYYKFYGHPVLFSFMLIVIFILAVILAVVLWRRKYRKKTYSSVNMQEVQIPLTGVQVDSLNADSGVGETDSSDRTSDQGVVCSVRKRKSSVGSSGRKVSLSQQDSNSNSNTGSDFTDEKPSVQSPVVVSELSGENDVFNEEKPSQVPERRRTSSGSSGKKFRLFNRQNSNPIPEHKEEKSFHKRSNTFSNFSTLLSGQKIGTTEETTSLLSSTDYNDNDISSQLVEMPPETSSSPANELSGENDVFEKKHLQTPERRRTLSGSSGKRNRLFNRQNSNPVPEHKEEKETTSLLSSTDYNDNDISPEIVALPPKTSSSPAPRRLSGVKIGQLNAETYRQLCSLLNLDIQNKNWQTLAGRMKYTNQEVKGFNKTDDPADKLLDHWGVAEGNDVARLIELVRGMNRDDIVKLLESPESHPTKFYL